MNLLAVCVLATLAVSALAFTCQEKCPGAADRSECDCCEEPCCCRCTEGGDSGIIPMCTSKLDVVLIVDASGSIGSSGWAATKKFLISVVNSFDNVGTDIKVSMVRFSDNATLDWNLGSEETASKNNLIKAIDDLELLGGITNTVEGFELALDSVLLSPYDDPKRNNVVLYFSDGRTSFAKTKIPGLARQLKSAARVISLGVTDVIDVAEMRLIASENSFFNVTAFDDLTDVLADVATTVCTSVPPVTKECFCCCPPPWELEPKTWFYRLGY